MSGPGGRLEPVSTPENSDVAELSYEAARDELVRVVTALESGGASLEESLALWERGNALADRCEQWLQGAKQRLDAARGAATGAASAPAEADEA
ncbi:exodeoxyribonuclease VII small subunit [Agrococcus sp. ARC_14]|uniref:exodeoxyribonuclease VII small subunit n=1 Tax=Agrococcus sp. ARC_14 TaxID=2919927 RepID=UPI001F06BE0C|nr:exodeoxyribonuclease VII small subunit [Agrococcus sp. ARC_14]MCH1883818.1 exodeoxyribonuclease VII small subunit [Agrococcus sp. ARC_14]